MTRLLLCAILAVAIALNTACDSGPAPVPPLPSTFTVLKSGDNLGIRAPEDSADAGTVVTITSGGSGSGTAAADGSVIFNATATDGPLMVSYIKAGESLTSELTVAPLSSLVSTPHFSTGSAPNDMELLTNQNQQAVDTSLFVANSLDNTVVRYALDGDTLGTVTFPVAASPSYVAIGEGETDLFVVANGNNLLYQLSLFDFTAPQREWPLTPTGAAFVGPGKPHQTAAGFVYVPRAEVQSFGPPAVYGEDTFEQFDLGVSPVTSRLFGSVPVHNGVFATAVPGGSGAYIVSAGELQFDENFKPFVTSESHLTHLAPEVDGTEQTLSLGPIGAASMAIASSRYAYFGNLLSGNLYKVDLQEQVVLRGEDNPIVLTEEHTYISDVEVAGNLLLATSFNTDELYVIDTATDTVNPAPYPGPFQVSPDPELLAGAIGVEVDTEGHAYVLLSIANAVARVDLLP